MGDNALQIFIGLAQLAVCALLLLGCSESVELREPLQEKNSVTQSQSPTFWHDGSIGGAYGIGEGWALEILPPKYETFTEYVVVQEGNELVTIPATFEWVKETSEILKTNAKQVVEIVTIPAKYETVTAPEEVKPAQTEYYLAEPVYDSTGTLKSPGAIKGRHVPAVMKNVTRRVIKVPARSEERVIPNVPLVRRDGYVRIVKTPAITKPRNVPDVTKTVTRRRVKHSQRLIVRHPNGEIAHIFDKYENLTAFVDSLN